MGKLLLLDTKLRTNESGKEQSEIEQDQEFMDKMQRIRTSLTKIDALMNELKNSTKGK
jgi:hypothetical protein